MCSYFIDEADGWGGKDVIKDDSKRVKRRCQNSMLNPSTEVCKMVNVLINGFSQKFSTRLKVTTINTCAFDSIYHVYRCLYVDYNETKVEVDSISDNSKFAELIAMPETSEKKYTKMFYEARNELLLNLFANDANTINTDNGIQIVDCLTNITYAIKGSLSESHELYSLCIERKCSGCRKFSNHDLQFIPINLNEFEQNGIAHLNYNIENSIDNIPEVLKNACLHCGGDLELGSITSNNIIIVDLQGKNANNFSISEVPSEIAISGSDFKLVGAIEYVGNKKHYIVHIRRKNQLWESFDDLLKNVFKTNLKKKIDVCVLMYKKDTSITIGAPKQTMNKP